MPSVYFLAYCSPARSTRHVAEVIEQTLVEREHTVHRFDLHGRPDPSAFLQMLENEAAENMVVAVVGKAQFVNILLLEHHVAESPCRNR